MCTWPLLKTTTIQCKTHIFRHKQYPNKRANLKLSLKLSSETHSGISLTFSAPKQEFSNMNIKHKPGLLYVVLYLGEGGGFRAYLEHWALGGDTPWMEELIHHRAKHTHSHLVAIPCRQSTYWYVFGWRRKRRTQEKDHTNTKTPHRQLLKLSI